MIPVVRHPPGIPTSPPVVQGRMLRAGTRQRLGVAAMEVQYYTDCATLRHLLRTHPEWTQKEVAASIGRSVAGVKTWARRPIERCRMLGPILRGEKISLEPPRPEDGVLRCAWFADLELSRWWTGPDVPSLKQEEESFERWARDESSVHWRIVLQGRTIGSTWLSAIDWRNRQAWQGMVIGERAEWGKGYG